MSGSNSQSARSSTVNSGTADSTLLSAPDMSYGDNWGVVGPDGSEDGFGVIGLETASPNNFSGMGMEMAAAAARERERGGGSLASATSTSAVAAAPNSAGYGAKNKDSHNVSGTSAGAAVAKAAAQEPAIVLSGDQRLVDESLRRSRGIETAPSFSGSRRINSGNVTMTSRVIMVRCVWL